MSEQMYEVPGSRLRQLTQERDEAREERRSAEHLCQVAMMARDEALAEVERLKAGLNLALDTSRDLAGERDEARVLARWYGQRLNEQGGMPRKEFNDAKFRYPWLEFPGWLGERR